MESGFSSAGAGALGTILLLNYSEMSPAQVVGTDLLFATKLKTAVAMIAILAGLQLVWSGSQKLVADHVSSRSRITAEMGTNHAR